MFVRLLVSAQCIVSPQIAVWLAIGVDLILVSKAAALNSPNTPTALYLATYKALGIAMLLLQLLR